MCFLRDQELLDRLQELRIPPGRSLPYDVKVNTMRDRPPRVVRFIPRESKIAVRRLLTEALLHDQFARDVQRVVRGRRFGPADRAVSGDDRAGAA